jgi:hypothetical protein
MGVTGIEEPPLQPQQAASRQAAAAVAQGRFMLFLSVDLTIFLVSAQPCNLTASKRNNPSPNGGKCKSPRPPL